MFNWNKILTSYRLKIFNTWHWTPFFYWIYCFYNNMCQWFEINIKVLRKIQQLCHRQRIPLLAWTLTLLLLVEQRKKHLTTSPVLAWFDNENSIFLKTDWSAESMGFILMQPNDSTKSLVATIKLRSTSIYDFHLTSTSFSLRPFYFNLRANKEYERDHYSFVGEVACGF